MSMWIQNLVIVGSLLPLASVGCKRPAIAGSGIAGKELREVGDFDQVVFLGSGRLEVAIGELQPLEVTADDNILPLLRTDVQEGRLTIRPTEKIRPRVEIRVTATVPNLKSFFGSGNAEAVLLGINTDVFSIEIEGNGKVVARGKSDRLKVSIAGNGEVATADLAARAAVVKIMGSGDVAVHAERTLDVSITGSGSVRYRGDPAIHRQFIGSGTMLRE